MSDKKETKWVRFIHGYELPNSFYRDLAPYLAEKGMGVEIVLSSVPYRKSSGRLADALQHELIRVTEIPAGFKEKTFGLLQKITIMITFIVFTSLYTLFGRGADLNVFITEPPAYSTWGIFLKYLRRQPYACLLMDIYPDLAIEDGIVSEDALLTRLLRWFVRLSWRHAEKIFVIGRCMEERLMAEGIPQEKIIVIPNWANEKQTYPIKHEENKFRQDLGLQDKFVVLYSGNMGFCHTFSEILEVAERCVDDEHIHFVFTGDGRRRAEILAFQEEKQLKNLTILPFQPLEQLAYSLSTADVHFVSLRDGFDGLVVPSKSYGALAVARPVIYMGNKRGEIAQMLTEKGVGRVVETGDVDRLEALIREYAAQPEVAVREGEEAYRLIHGELSREAGVEAYRVALESLLTQG